MGAKNKKSITEATGLLDQATQAHKGLRRVLDLFLRAQEDLEPGVFCPNACLSALSISADMR